MVNHIQHCNHNLIINIKPTIHEDDLISNIRNYIHREIIEKGKALKLRTKS